MKIAFISCSNGVVYRGVETFVHELANGVSKNNEVIVYQSGPEVSGAKYKTKTVPLNASWNKENGLRSLSKPLYLDFNFGNFLRRFYLDYWNRKQGEFTLSVLRQIDKDVDAVIIPGSGWVSLFCRLWTWVHKKKLIVAGQSGPGWDDRISLWCRPDLFIALSKHAGKWARGAGFGVRVEVIPNGVDLSKFRPDSKKAKTGLSGPLVLCVAALEPGKRVDRTIKAVSQIDKASLLVMGDGQSKEGLTELAEKLMPKRFKTVYVKHEEMVSYYNAADVITMAPMGYESFGIVFVEALACNKPVVASDDAIRREIIGNAGVFVDPEDTKEYADGIKKALEKRWGDIPRKRAEEFSWEKIARKYEEVIKSLL